MSADPNGAADGFSDSLQPAGDSSRRALSGSMMLVSDIAGVAAD
jgi:hypothetical protein